MKCRITIWNIGILTLPDGSKFDGDFKDGKAWNGKFFDKNGKFHVKVVNGKEIKQLVL